MHSRLAGPLPPGTRLTRFSSAGEGTVRAVRTPALHELAGQLDRVPLDAAYAGHQPVRLLRQHVLQRVAELVEERLNLLRGAQGAWA